jgi:RNA polymerase sigma factor for flagellar operon FliA
MKSKHEKLVLEYRPLVRFIASRIQKRLPANIEYDDLVSAGMLGLMDAIQKYDPSRDNQFKTYAEFRIHGAILDELREQDWIPRSVRDKAKIYDRVLTQLETELQRKPTDREIAEKLGISMEEYFTLTDDVKGVVLLNIEDLTERGSSKGFLRHENNPIQTLEWKRLRELVLELMAKLPPNQQIVLSLYYFADYNLKEIGKFLNVSESRISQIHSAGIRKLKKFMDLKGAKSLYPFVSFTDTI